ncbi:VCBS repeat-containing protein [Lutibacter sp. B2]|nr:VCBS repeat-containing protein [Lutibacter sp. B2]
MNHPYYPFYKRSSQPYNYYVLDFKQGDVTGDRIIDDVYLIGRKTGPSEIFADNIFILIRNTITNKYLKISLKDIGGYNGQLFLNYFTSENKLDILTSIDSGGSGGYIFTYLYGIKDDTPILLFDWETFNGTSMYSAKFKNAFKVDIIHEDETTKFIIDVSSNKKMYIDMGIYDEQGTLLKPTNGGVLGIGALFPIVTNYNGLCELLALQRIIGVNNSDNLGAIQTYLKWDGEKIAIDRIQTAIMEV